MKRGGVALVVTVLLAVAAAGAVFLYVTNVKQSAETQGGTVAIVVAKEDIPASTDLDPLIDEGMFETRTVLRDDMVQGAVTDVYQLRGQRTAYPILAGEQIAAARLQGELQAAGGLLGIPEGHEAVTVSLDAPRAVAGALGDGDDVTIYATFDNVAASVTIVLVPQVQVLRVYGSTGGIDGSEQVQQATGTLFVTLALLPEDAQKLVFSMEQGTVWLGLLPPNASGKDLKPISFAQVLR